MIHAGQSHPRRDRATLHREEEQMRGHGTTICTAVSLLIATIAARSSPAQTASSPAAYPAMAPLDQYMIADRDAEVALARSAAPASISRNAEVLVLGRRGYETAVRGTNGFTCVVERSWGAGPDDPEFWNPSVRAPICFNPAADRSYLPLTIRKTALVLAGRSAAQIADSIRVAWDTRALPSLEAGAMCYMMSPHQYLNDHDRQWRPHLMFFVPQANASWGADLAGSPVIAAPDVPDHMTVFVIPVGRWSDGTGAPADAH